MGDSEMKLIHELIQEIKNLQKENAILIEIIGKYQDLRYSPEELKEKLELAWQYEELNR
jgi:hypothetical protein